MSGNYTEAEDAALIESVRLKVPNQVIADTLRRSLASVRVRVHILRTLGLIAPVVHKGLQTYGIMNAPAIVLKDDAKLVERCLAEGGFPRAVVLSCGTVWAGPDGKLWNHTPSQNRRGIGAAVKLARAA